MGKNKWKISDEKLGMIQIKMVWTYTWFQKKNMTPMTHEKTWLYLRTWLYLFMYKMVTKQRKYKTYSILFDIHDLFTDSFINEVINKRHSVWKFKRIINEIAWFNDI